jgi:putative ABC transport system substrate-binding protein
MAATSTVPIIFIGSDPVQIGLAATYSRPGGNATGINTLLVTLGPKRLGLLHDLVPQAAQMGMLVNPAFPQVTQQITDVRKAARSIGLEIQVFQAGTESEIDTAFETMAKGRVAALVLGADPFYDTRRDKLVGLAAHYAIPAMYYLREFAAAGGLISYGIDLPDAYRQLGVYTGRVLKGEKPADLPVLQPTKFEFVINLQTARALKIEVPPGLLAIADEVIE